MVASPNPTYLYGSFDPVEGFKTLLTRVAPREDFAIEILREFSSTEFIGRILAKASTGNWVRMTLPGIANYAWYQTFLNTGRTRFFVEGSGAWDVLFFRRESDDSGPYVAVGLKLPQKA